MDVVLDGLADGAGGLCAPGRASMMVDGVLPAATVLTRMIEEAAELLSGGGALI
ncbi:MAG: hypothetical protein ACI8TP_000456 [Acidimicrobiales bacterium]